MITSHSGSLRRRHGRWRWRRRRRRRLGWRFSAAVCILVVVHPHLQDITLNPELGAELGQNDVVLLLYPPTQPLGQLQHSLFLLLRELGPESLVLRRRHHRGHLHIPPLRRLRPSIILPLPIILMMMMMMINATKCGNTEELMGKRMRGSILRAGSGVIEQHGMSMRGSGVHEVVMKVRCTGYFPSMEVAVAPARRARQRSRITSAATAGGHELTAAVAGMATDGGSMVSHALSVPGLYGGRFGVHDHWFILGGFILLYIIDLHFGAASVRNYAQLHSFHAHKNKIKYKKTKKNKIKLNNLNSEED